MSLITRRIVSLGAWVVLSVAFFLTGSPAYSLSSNEAVDKHSSATLVLSRYEALADDEMAIQGGILLKMDDEWHSYWRTPGDAGLPLKLSLGDSENIKSFKVFWPYPKRLSEEDYDLQTFIYEGEVVIPVRFRLEDANKPVKFALKADYMVCRDICLPATAELRLEVPANAAFGEEEQTKVEEWVSRIPPKNSSDVLQITSISEGFGEDEKFLEVAFKSKYELKSAEAFIEDAEGKLKFNAPDFASQSSDTRQGSENGRFLYTLIAPYAALYDGEAATLSLEDLTITLVAFPTETAMLEQSTPEAEEVLPSYALEMKAADVSGNESSPKASPAETGGGGAESQDATTNAPSFWQMILFAAIGGLILNIMPCVLPVLSIKVLSVLKHGGGKTKDVRSSFLVTSLGIITSFAVLAGITTALRSAGMAAGWGFHFQEPGFIVALIFIIVLFACNLWGIFEINLPSWLGGKISTVFQGEPEKKSEHSLTGNFLTGALATILATPCTAPFLGTAVGFALAEGGVRILLIFLSMGFGMAIPYLIFAVFPSAITLLPKPGAWMVRVKQALGFVMILAAIWLVWVLSMQAGDLSAIVVIITALILIIKLKVLKNHPLFSRGSVILTVAIFAALFNVLLANKLNDSRMSSAALSGAGFWKEFNQQEIESLVAAGNVVFVDVTADWCITCKVNKAFFVESEDVIEAMNKPNIVAMQADWTNRNEEIAQYLQSFGRYGIPFNVVYGPGAPEGIILPELLSKSVVIEALKKAEGE